MRAVDAFVNRITMYRLLLYVLIAFCVVAFGFDILGVLPYDPVLFAGSTLFLVAVCWLTNTIFAKTFHAVANVESAYLSALILALIVTPATTWAELVFLFWAAVLSMALKYIIALRKKHIFNPVALALTLMALLAGHAASWWVGTSAMLPVIFIGGFLIIRKIRRFDLVTSFLFAAIVVTVGYAVSRGSSLDNALQHLVLFSPLLFFASIMLTEPLTTPPTRRLRIMYGALIGLMFAPQFHVGSLYTTPELALVAGNVFSYLVSPKFRTNLFLIKKMVVGAGIVDLGFRSDTPWRFRPGQYLEFTLPVPKSDSRGNRRYFTIASSPTEETIRLGVKFYEPASRFKQELANMRLGDMIVGSQLTGDFVLPNDARKKLVFIAGGIGVTPFRSMVKYLVDTGQQRDIVLLYSNKTADEVVYSNVFGQAEALGVRTVYTLTNENEVPSNWLGRIGKITPDVIQEEIPDFRGRFFYLSGPHAMVTYYEQVLAALGVHKKNIHVDYFPGFA